MSKNSLLCQLLFGVVIWSATAIAADKVVVIPFGGAVGDATVADVLRGKTFSSQSGRGGTGTRPPAPVEKTGSQACNGGEGNCDGDLQTGESWPSPRFYTGAILAGMGRQDRLTGLVWYENPGITTKYNFANAVQYCQNLATGIGGLYSDWRLPSIKELQSLIDFGQAWPALPAGHPFEGVQGSGYFWSSTTRLITDDIDQAYCVDMAYGKTLSQDKTMVYNVWCVRGPYY
jgi:hypothetical protein